MYYCMLHIDNDVDTSLTQDVFGVNLLKMMVQVVSPASDLLLVLPRYRSSDGVSQTEIGLQHTIIYNKADRLFSFSPCPSLRSFPASLSLLELFVTGKKSAWMSGVTGCGLSLVWREVVGQVINNIICETVEKNDWRKSWRLFSSLPSFLYAWWSSKDHVDLLSFHRLLWLFLGILHTLLLLKPLPSTTTTTTANNGNLHKQMPEGKQDAGKLGSIRVESKGKNKKNLQSNDEREEDPSKPSLLSLKGLKE